ncbi:MAG TPA: M20/M25/M40 family metallo-hydrolase [Candidatus Eisenbacteria bacterium]|nr:M20/M25/M40 family metallo-hydrolase [Candidatus Eisenbacteria bacterium]
MARAISVVPMMLVTFAMAAIAVPSRAQLSPSQTDALSKLQASQTAAACSATDASSCAQAAAKLMPIILGDSPMIENLRKLTDEIGGRVTGTPEMAKAVQWGVAGFRAAGVDVHPEKYTLPVTWKEGATRLTITTPATTSTAIRAVSEGWGPATPRDGIEANVIDIGDGSEAEISRAGSIKGALLLVRSEIGSSWPDLFNEYMRPPGIIARAVKDGAAAILWTGARERLLLYRHTNALNGEVDKIPQAVVAREDALRLARLVAGNPGKVRARLTMPNEVSGPAEQENVVGEIRGYEKPEEVVILGAHLDSWELGTGALDNGCNAALVIEASRAIKAMGALPKRTIRFVLFGGEEQGTIGSFAYVKSHAAELDKIRAVIIFDAGSGRVSGYSLGGRSDTEPGLNQILKPLETWSVNQHTADASFGTDNFDFLLEGVPTFVANQEISNYLANYHAASDTFDKVDQRELKMNAVIAALTAWGIADRTEPIGKRLTRAELDAIVKQTGLDQQMQLLGYWQQWQTGVRGRKP